MSFFSLSTGRRAEVRHPRSVTALLSGLAHEWALRRARRAMSRLDDALLHDIGVDRGDIDAAVRHGRDALGR